MTDSTNLIRLVQEIQPDEIYNLAAQSHIQMSFDTPEYSANADAMGALHLVESIRILGMEKNAGFIRRQRPSFMVWCGKYRRVKRYRSIPARPIPRPRCMLNGSP